MTRVVIDIDDQLELRQLIPNWTHEPCQFVIDAQDFSTGVIQNISNFRCR